MRSDVKWCPLETQGADTKTHKLRAGMRGLLAIKINTIEVALCNGNEARVRATLRCDGDGIAGSPTAATNPYLQSCTYSQC